MIIDWVPRDVVIEVRAADAAARAARAVPGVVRLQPGIWGLVRQLAALAWERATGQDLPDIAGVQAELTDNGGIRVDLRLAVDGRRQVTAVGVAVQDAVTAAVSADVDIAVIAVRVHIVEVVLGLD